MTLDLTRIARHGHGVATLLETDGAQALRLARDWESPLRAAAGGRTSRGDHADPAADAALNDDPLRLRHSELIAAINAFHNAGTLVMHLIESTANRDTDALKELSEAETARERSMPTCQACESPTAEIRSGWCDACRKTKARDGTAPDDRVEFGNWVRRRVAEGTLLRPASPWVTIEKRTMHEGEVA